MIIQRHDQDINTPTGTMRCTVYRPQAEGRFPCIFFYSEIFQQTSPIARSAAMMAGHGFVVIVPEVFHELNPIGTVLGYDDEGKDKGNSDKFTKTLEAHDSDTVAMISYFEQEEYCTGQFGAMGVCLGGHLAYRAALNPCIQSAFCLYATDIHSNTIPCEEDNDSFTRTKDIQGELVMVWGKQDPHVSTQGRQKVYQQLIDTDRLFTWHEFNGQHAFMRDEGDRYDPALALECYNKAVALFHSTLHKA
ncbi:dienelactone hydrolase family protein [Marinomonas primoryensis]|jgi:carboxymethylenebutenolidase|uniref:Alpha/beta hydrolase n=1 Tax=Marinomonas primoryensis TaxID=178399 RepID=A0A859CWK0_9GAMM|nr:dienelactone hydrolase family protein [Marinomonas primoryensis]QKK80968.1 alpha/beta hydrolase [Marinomonas primoryensis]|tara:strand:+ start:439 stop:1182 length:744 start_codon:yes stop_codon:yes gene_type:complete